MENETESYQFILKFEKSLYFLIKPKLKKEKQFLLFLAIK